MCNGYALLFPLSVNMQILFTVTGLIQFLWYQLGEFIILFTTNFLMHYRGKFLLPT